MPASGSLRREVNGPSVSGRLFRMASDPLSPGAKFRLTLEMFETGVELMRQNLRRSHPLASPVELDRMLVNWLRTRPGAEHGDGVGRPRKPAA